MSDNSRIEWTDATLNVVVGCTKVSPGCDHCYAERDVNRWNGNGAFDTVVLKPERLDLPFSWRRPRRIFVNSLSDLFHEDIPDEFIARVFAVMAATPRHAYQILTKRHGRMRSLLRSEGFRDLFDLALRDLMMRGQITQVQCAAAPGLPLPNVWLGVSVEDQKWADVRVPALLDTPAAVRFLSCEPLLGPVSLRGSWHDYLAGWMTAEEAESDGRGGSHPVQVQTTGVDWVIVGGESGPGARPMQAEWARTLRDQCAAAGVPYLFKQWGQHDEHGVRRRSKHDAGRELDGRTHDEFPQREGVRA